MYTLITRQIIHNCELWITPLIAIFWSIVDFSHVLNLWEYWHCLRSPDVGEYLYENHEIMNRKTWFWYYTLWRYTWIYDGLLHKQSSGCVLLKRCSYKYRKIHRKTPGLRPATLIKKETLSQVLSCEFYEIFKSTFSDTTLPVAASAALKSLTETY